MAEACSGRRRGIDAVFDDMVDLRRAVHRRPELAFAEHATTALIRDHMAALGIDEAAAGHRDRRHLRHGGRPARPQPSCCGPTSTRCPCRRTRRRPVHSEVDGAMHACGHDVHVASLLGVASVAGRRAARTCPGATSSCSSRARRPSAAPSAMVENGALDVMEGARLVGFHVTSQLPDRAWSPCAAASPCPRRTPCASP